MLLYAIPLAFVIFISLLEIGVFDKDVRVTENALLPDYGNIIGHIPDVLGTFSSDEFLHIKGKADSSEAILICFDQTLFSRRLIEGFKVFSEKQNILAKDLIVTFNSREYINQALDLVDSVVASVFVSFDDSLLADGCIDAVDLQYDSSSGVLPNLDLISCSSKILEIQKIRRKIGYDIRGSRIPSWLIRRLMSTNEVNLHSEKQVESLGLKVSLSRKWRDGQCSGAKELYRALESIVQSLNNLEEKFHQSSSFYMILTAENFVPFSIYLANSLAAPIMLLLLLLKFTRISKNLDVKDGLMISYLKIMQLSLLDLSSELLRADEWKFEALLAHVVELILYFGFHDGAISISLSLWTLGLMTFLNVKLNRKHLLN